MPLKSLDECTEQQRKFIAAITSPEALDIPRKSRWRWAATTAGYSENTAISSIIDPLQGLLREAAEKIMTRTSVEAALQLSGMLNGDVLDAQDKDRLAAAKEVLDRTIPKKTEQTNTQQIAPAVVILPVKIETAKIIEGEKIEDGENLLTCQEG